MEKTIQLARGTIAADADLTIYLVRRLSRGHTTELVVFRWPNQPTRIESATVTPATATIISVLAAARIELAAIRATELIRGPGRLTQ